MKKIFSQATVVLLIMSIVVTSCVNNSGKTDKDKKNTENTDSVNFVQNDTTNQNNSIKNAENGHTWVDLGLPSGTLWATCNVGANSPEEYGLYFQWGDAQGYAPVRYGDDHLEFNKKLFAWSDYKYEEYDLYTFKKYCPNAHYGKNGYSDTLTRLLPEDDAATANWGEAWRMPTVDDVRELCENCSSKWTNQNGVNGYLLTSLNGNSIFLPAAGKGSYKKLEEVGKFCCYWTNSLFDHDPNPYAAWCIYFNTDDRNVTNINRTCGFSVRPVLSNHGNNSETNANNNTKIEHEVPLDPWDGYYLPDYPFGTGENVGIRGITTRPVYTWADENLFGKVKSYIETSDENSITKKFNEKGGITYYHVGPGVNHFRSIDYDVYPLGVPNLDKKNSKGAQIISDRGVHSHYMLDHNWLNPALMNNCYEASFKYDTHGNISAIYHDGKLYCEFEYDEYGHLVKKMENGKPTMKIVWDYGETPNHVTYSIKFYTPEGYNKGEYKYGWKEHDKMAKANIVDSGFWYPEFTFYDYPQVKTVSKGDLTSMSTDCFFYDAKKHIKHLVTASNTIYCGDHLEGVCKSYKYNNQGDVCSESISVIPMSLSACNWDYNKFIDYILSYNFSKLPVPNKETVWHYVYDSHGNWTNKECYEVVHGDIDIENLKETITRKYEYYE